MQEYWEMYMKPVEGKPASVLFNAGVSYEIDELKHLNPIVAFVKVKLKEPDERGLMNQEEAKEISYLEDRLEAGILKFRLGKYVGRIVSDGYVTFIYYVPYTFNWEDFLAFALEEHAHYEITSGYRDDPQWGFYNNLLFPTAVEWQIIQNHRACDTLREQGDALEQARAIEHKLFYEEGCDKAALHEALEAEGYGILEPITNDEGKEGVRFFRIDTPFYTEIDEITLRLIALCEEHGAAYDGWETSVVK
jgi:regulator of RNase E activity RraB